jgi:hypothetical protein
MTFAEDSYAVAAGQGMISITSRSHLLREMVSSGSRPARTNFGIAKTASPARC